MDKSMAKIGLAQFMRQVKQEVKKISWPGRKETSMSTVMVIIIAAIASTFFFFVDQVLAKVIQIILGFGG